MSLHEPLKENSESFVMFQQEENQPWATARRDASVVKRRPAVSRPVRRPIIKIFIVYETELNRDRAQFMREELGRRLGQSFAFSVSWRSLKSLEDPKMRKTAARSVAEADIICFSLLSGGELSENVTKWIENGIFGRETSKLCLLALVETGGTAMPRLSRAEVYLSQLSFAAGVDCLCYSDSIPIARSIRGKQQERQPGKSTRAANRAPHGGTRRGQEFPIIPPLIPSRRRLPQFAGRGNLQPQQIQNIPVE